MDSLSFNLYERVRLPDRREGFLQQIFSPGWKPGGKRPSDILTVLTDDYHEVDCSPWQVTKIRRARGQTVKSKDPKGSFYPVELENEARLRMAIWHDHWDRYPPQEVPAYHDNYWKEYSRGNKVLLPVEEDIRDQVPAPAQKPEQLSMF